MFMSLMAILMLFISLMLIIVQFLLSSDTSPSDNVLTPLESGFENMKHSVLMSSSFMSMAILFVIFDMELVLLLPGVYSSLWMDLLYCIYWYILLLLVMSSLLGEWATFGLKWNS